MLAATMMTVICREFRGVPGEPAAAVSVNEALPGEPAGEIGGPICSPAAGACGAAAAVGGPCEGAKEGSCGGGAGPGAIVSAAIALGAGAAGVMAAEGAGAGTCPCNTVIEVGRVNPCEVGPADGGNMNVYAMMHVRQVAYRHDRCGVHQPTTEGLLAVRDVCPIFCCIADPALVAGVLQAPNVICNAAETSLTSKGRLVTHYCCII